jgi:predicted Zn-dependent protease
MFRSKLSGNMVRLSGLSILSLVLVSMGTVAQPAPAADQPTMAGARSLMEQGRLDEAQRELIGLAKQQPEAAGVERLRGIVSYEKNDLPEAEAAFARAVTQDPGDLESMQMQGVVLFRLGKPAEAIPLLEKAHGSESIANADPNYALALCYIDTGRYDDARRAFAAQYGFEPDSAAAWLLTARMLFRQERSEPAEADTKEALQLEPTIPFAHRLLGEMALARGDVPGAIAEFEKERELNPLDGETYDRLGDAYLRGGQYAQAQQALDRAVLLEPNSTGPYILLGRVLLEQKDPLTATMYLERAAKMDPSNSMTHMLLARAFQATGRKEDAEREAKVLEKLQESKINSPTTP